MTTQTQTKTHAIRYKIGQSADGRTNFKMLITHPMETGYRRDKKTGKKIPADFIQTFSVSLDGEEVVTMTLGENISKNPYFGFYMPREVFNGQVILIKWTDNNGVTMSNETQLEYNEKGDLYVRGIMQPINVQ